MLSLIGHALHAEEVTLQELAEKIKLLEQQLALTKAQLNTIKEQQEKEQEVVIAATNPEHHEPIKTEPIEPVAPVKLKKKTSDSPVIKGLVQFEANAFDGIYTSGTEDDSGSDVFIRRTHYRVFHRANDNLDYVLLFFGSEDSTNVLVGFARYQPTDNFEFRLGRIKEDRTLSLAYIGEELPAERPMVINAFATAFQIGAQAHYITDNNFRISAAVVEDKKYAGDNDGRDDDGDLILGYNVRGTWSHKTSDSVLHLGSSYGLRQMNSESFSLTERGGIRNAENRLSISPTLSSAKHAQIYMGEFAWQKKAFRVEAEYGIMDVESSLATEQDLSFSGYYINTSYFLDGVTRLKYNNKYAQFGRPTNQNGVWQIFGRYSTLDLIDSNAGTKVDLFMLGASYDFNPYWNFQLQYYLADVSGPGLLQAPFTTIEGTERDGDGFVARWSYRF
jgi:phosphate-selective porin OprO/OprP